MLTIAAPASTATSQCGANSATQDTFAIATPPLVGNTDDPAWPCVLNVLVCREECGLGPYPDLRIAARLWEQCGADAVCGIYPFAGDFDPHDPYWALACVGGRWYVASTVNARFKLRPGEGVRLVRSVAVPE